MNILGLLLGLLGGVLICWINYKISKLVLTKKQNLFSSFSFLRQILNIGYLVGCYFLVPFTPFERTYLLIGGALGITLPMFYFTSKLLKMTNKNYNVSEGDE